jgi:hypothetical protein
MITNPAFRNLGSDAILLTRDIFADAASVAADLAKDAAKNARPSEQERKEGVDFEAAKVKGKKAAKGLASGRIQGEAREGLFDEVEKVKEYFDEKLPEGEEAKDRVISKLQQVCLRFSLFPFDAWDPPLTPRSLRKRRRTPSTEEP